MKRYCAFVAAVLVAVTGYADLVVVGELQTEQGDATDWDPVNSSLIMTDLGGGLYSYIANNLLDGTLYKYKVLDDGGTPPANWGDPETVNRDTMAYGDADGSVEITVNLNLSNGAGGAVTWANSDNAPLQVVGDFMDEAGGAGDWNPADPTFAMTPLGSGLYTIDLTVSAPGSYEFKATDGLGWDRQVGTDGMSDSAGAFLFSTTTADEALTLFVDLANGQIGVVPEPSTLVLAGLGLTALWMKRRREA